MDAILEVTLRDALLAVWGLATWSATYVCLLAAFFMWLAWKQVADGVPEIEVELPKKCDSGEKAPPKHIPCHDPTTGDLLGYAPDLSPDEVHKRISLARAAQKQWAKTSFATRRRFLRTLLRHTVAHQEDICKVAALDSGKVLVDAAFGETLVTCEKIQWVCGYGERYLRPEHRETSALMMYKRPRVEYHPVGVMGAIVPWNYPFTNFMNPIISSVFAGNAVVIKVSEHASWSAPYFLRMVRAALKAVGGPEDLVQVVTGYAEVGRALVSGGVDKVIFVGSPGVGKKVMEVASQTLTPVVLELGGKDPIVLCEDTNLDVAVPICLRGSFQSCGQNCAGCERVVCRAEIYDAFCEKVGKAASGMRPGSSKDYATQGVDFGAMCMPKDPARMQQLVDDAVSKGARILAGGKLPPSDSPGQFFPPTVLADVTQDMRVAKEEIFGPIMCVFKVASDQEAIDLVNDCSFGLGSNVFSKDTKRANAIAAELKCGMSSINDFATSYMCQSLPWGGVKDSGFLSFAGVEGLRGCCTAKAVVEDIWPFSTDIPVPLRYPVSPKAFQFCSGLISMFYGWSIPVQASGLFKLLSALLSSASSPKQD